MQIQVKDTKMHTIQLLKTPQRDWKSEIPVVEGTLVLIEERDKPIFYKNITNPHHPFGYLLGNYYTAERHPNDKKGPIRKTGDSKGRKIGLDEKGMWKGVIPVIISETEKIEVGDKFLINNTIRECVGYNSIMDIKSNNNLDYQIQACKKILALPEHFSPKYLQDIVDGRIKKDDKVLVECEDFCDYEGEEPYDRVSDFRVKLNSQGHITLHKVEEKMYNLDEVKEIIRQVYVDGYENGYVKGVWVGEIDKCIAKYLK